MMTVMDCIGNRHDMWVVAIAAAVCLAGSWAVVTLFLRTVETGGVQRVGWHFLCASAAGSSIWCTHFIAILAYRPGAPVAFDPVLTILSLLLAMIGASFGFIVATSRSSRAVTTIGGVLLGLSISLMHYTGMMAYRVQGLVTWDWTYAAASVLLSVIFSTLALHAAKGFAGRRGRYVAVLSLCLGIVSLHFVGMAALRITPLLVDLADSNASATQTLALALGIAAVAIIIDGSGFFSYLIDDRARAASLETFKKLALHDSLTGLPNRTLFRQRLDEAVRRAARGERFAILCLDLDHFKPVNDTLGHPVGDALLTAVAERLKEAVRDTDTVARLGGDEFAIIQTDINQAWNATSLVTRLIRDIAAPYHIGGHHVVTGISVGIALVPEDGTDAVELMKNADLALYRAKGEGRGRYSFFEREMNARTQERRLLELDLQRAVEAGEFELHYQPIYDIREGAISGCEALMRWHAPGRGQVSPAEFIPMAEEIGLITGMGAWALETACREAAGWPEPNKVAVNVSAIQFKGYGLIDAVRSALDKSGLAPERLEIEITESVLVADSRHACDVLHQVKALGVSIALDDFGTGYSSLSYLRSFPFDKIKIDRSFIKGLGHNVECDAIIQAVMSLCDALGIIATAEGVETEEQMTLLRLQRCRQAQGYLISRPQPPADIARMLAAPLHLEAVSA